MAANRKLLAVAVACTAVVGIAGCGGDGGDKDPFDGMSADKIADKASAASKGAGSYRMVGEFKEEGGKNHIDLAVSESGGCKGSMTSTRKGKAEILASGKDSYIKAGEDFWKAQTGSSTAGEIAKGRWVKSPGGSPCGQKDMFKNDNLNNLERKDDAEVDGKKTAVLTRKKGKETTTFYVAMEGKPYFLKVDNEGGDGAGTVTFSDYGKPVDVKAPPADQVVDPAKLGGGS
ncbi:hypothetical protein GPA10_00485 [Streptomyces sp. p1417]|uniref:Lipoprotein n=1 Tax=Streptomyces typhae TaxID=2681492 RepID=A0A6L6WM00_9ACTN|nr:hypothetical protein [Streptomyces typhae]MVO83272.1 hypothetical protein [Streptomyces typhae]